MESQKARVFTRLMKVLNRKPHRPISSAPPSLSLMLNRYFSDRRRPMREKFNSNGGDSYEPRSRQNPNRPMRGQRPFNPSKEPNKTPTHGSPLQSLSNAFSANPEKRRDDSRIDEMFLEKFKLGLDKKENEKEKQSTDEQSQQERQQKETEEEKLSGPQEADEIFRKMKETGLIPNAVAMLDGLCKDGLVQEALKLFGSMREKGTMPEVVVYTAVVDGFCKAHKLDDAKRVFRKMQKNGITPNAFSFGVLIQGLYKCNKLDDAVDFCVEMLEAGFSPNVITFVGLVDGFCKEKGVEEARNIIETLKQKGFYVNDKAIREYLDKKAPCSPMVWEAILGKKAPERPF